MKNWDLYFLRIAREVSKQSKCLSRQIGAILVKDKAIISTGYNGPARGVKHCNERNLKFYADVIGVKALPVNNELCEKAGEVCPRRYFNFKSGQGLYLCQAGHAERNALIQAARNGISTKNTTLYCYCSLPCLQCMVEIINSGVSKLVYLKGEDYDRYSRILLEESKLKYTEYEETEL